MTKESCNQIQERIVAGEALDESGQDHVLGCPGCGRCAAEWSALDAEIADAIDGGVVVPEGFADRVMAQIEESPATPAWLERWLGRRSVQLILAHVGLCVAGFNLLRFVFSTLVPAASLGGSP
jgi:anti-sigma factor RsiW